MSFKASINNNNFEIHRSDNSWRLNGIDYSISVSDKSDNIIMLKAPDGTITEATLQGIDTEKKQVKLLLHQKELVIDILEPVDQTMLSLGIDTKKLQRAKNIKAPMPGLILKTLVKEGQTVKAGDPLFILEAMKMENIFKAPDDVTIKNILIQEGETVDKNQELIVFT